LQHNIRLVIHCRIHQRRHQNFNSTWNVGYLKGNESQVAKIFMRYQRDRVLTESCGFGGLKSQFIGLWWLALEIRKPDAAMAVVEPRLAPD
jgi:hypothetical protein